MYSAMTYVLLLLVLAGIFTSIFAWARSRPHTMAECTNRILFAIVILLFAIVIKLISTGMDIVVLIIGLVGLGVGWYGLSTEPH